MSEKMWAGRFKKQLDSDVNDFNSSIRVDCRMYKSDIGGSIAHAAMLARQGIIDPADAEATADKFDLLLGDNLAGRKDYIANYGHLYIDMTDVS